MYLLDTTMMRTFVLINEEQLNVKLAYEQG